MKMALISVLFFAVATHSFGASQICLEAESAQSIVKPVAIKTDEKAGASGNGYLEVPQKAGARKPQKKAPKGEAKLTFTVTAEGSYVIWARTWWLDRCGNSVTMVLDDGRPFTCGQDATYKTWHWVKVKKLTFDLKPGKHTLLLKNKEDGIKIDQILLSKNQRYVPVDTEEVTAAKEEK